MMYTKYTHLEGLLPAGLILNLLLDPPISYPSNLHALLASY